MTTSAKPKRLERMEFEVSAKAAMALGRAAYREAVRARAEESRLTRELEASERLGDALARELGTLVCQVLEADRERDAAREEAERLRGLLRAYQPQEGV